MTPWTIIVLAVVAIVAHLAVAFASRKINVLFLLAAVFTALSLFSVARALPFVYLLKYARVYTTLVMVLLGIYFFGIRHLGPSVKAMLVFTFFSTMSPLWGPLPLAGLAYKSFFVLTLVAGMWMAYSVKSWGEAYHGIRWFVLLTAFGTVAGIIFIGPLGDAAAARLSFLDINPNRIGGTAASLMLLCGYVAVYDRSRRWRSIGWVSFALLAMLVLMSGSRAGALTAAIGFLIVLRPLLRDPQRFMAAAVVLIGVGAATFFVLGENPGMRRMMSLENTRASIWEGNMMIVRMSPVFGHGWLYAGPHVGYSNLHSMYFQILAESGFVGFALFLICLGKVLANWYQAYRFVSERYPPCEYAILPFSFIASALVIGIFETAALQGVCPDALLLGFGVALIDRLPALARRSARPVVAPPRPGPRAMPAF